MVNISRNTFSLSFSILCVIGVVLMVSYWIYKFTIEDRDIGVVDYVSFEEAEDVLLPVVSVCFANPFFKEKLNEANPNTNITAYLKYLKGDVLNEKFEYIDYENVTLDLENYFSHSLIKLSNGTLIREMSLKFKHKVIFNGFYHSKRFVKCFAITINSNESQNIKQIFLYYKKQKLIEDFSIPFGYGMIVYSNIHYQEQFLLEINPPPKYYLTHDYGGMDVIIKGIEVLKRRNSRNKRCTMDWRFYDDLVLKKHVRSNGCRPPYIGKYNWFPICNSSEDIKRATYDFNEARTMYYPKACQRISNLYKEVKMYTIEHGLWKIGIVYPEEVRIITQSKEVDIHTLIGNIGGYIGFFLGYALIQIPALILGIYDNLKKHIRNNFGLNHSGNRERDIYPENQSVLDTSDAVFELRSNSCTQMRNMEHKDNTTSLSNEKFETLMNMIQKQNDEVAKQFQRVTKRIDDMEEILF